MKTLYIVRHAKSSWNHPELQDEERPLMEKGKKRTRFIIDYLLQNGTSVDLIISSHAVRARETAKIIAHSLNYREDNIQISRNVYHGDEDSFYNLLYDLSENIGSVMVVGHNPAMTNFSNRFLRRKIDWLPTSAIVRVDFDTNAWTDIHKAGQKVVFYVTPKLLKEKKNRKGKNQVL
ncbi:MAG: histidine phosphatase family protein [Bacteroidales bacterium]|nr:histidine phosphatase family protein [Bacteroidales bacterium]